MICPSCSKLISERFPLHDYVVVIRYYVSPASTIRGWYVKRVLKSVEGKGTSDRRSVRFDTKREAHAAKDAYNKLLIKNSMYEAIQ